LILSQSGELWTKKRLKLYLYYTHSLERTKFSGISKTQWFQQYTKAEVDVPRAHIKLPMEGDLTQKVKDELTKFVCSKYCPKGVRITSIPDLRWHLFCKQVARSDKLPTLGALEEHIKCVRLQSRVWCQATVIQQQPFYPLKFGYYKDTGVSCCQ